MKKLSSTEPVWGCCPVDWCKKRLTSILICHLKTSFFLPIWLLLVELVYFLSMYGVKLLFEVSPHWEIKPSERIRTKRIVGSYWADPLMHLQIVFENIVFGGNFFSVWCIGVISLFGRYDFVFYGIVKFGRVVLWHNDFCWSSTATVSSRSSTASSIVFSFGNVKGERILWLLWVLGNLIFLIEMAVLSFIRT